MCGRFSQHYTWSEIHGLYSLIGSQAPVNIEPRYNIGRFQSAYIIRSKDDAFILERALFEFVPFFWKKPLKEKKYSSFNAVGEKLITGETKSFVASWKGGKRGLLPVSGFYEWPRPKKAGQAPYFITSAKAPVLSLGIIWSVWEDAESGEERTTFAIVTTPPNKLMESIPHHRCPLVIADKDREQWTQGTQADAERLLKPPPATAMQKTLVSSYVNKIGNEGPECVAAA